VTWAKNVGWQDSEQFYKALAIAILVEVYGEDWTVGHTGYTVGRVRELVAVHEIASQPRIETSPEDYARSLQKVLEHTPLSEVAQRIGRSPEWIRKQVKLATTARIDTPLLTADVPLCITVEPPKNT
jgi:hypothetical protein